jgi:hypothetical protein
MTSGKYGTSMSLTCMPSSVGKSVPFSRRTYSRSWMVERICAYVDGRPIPCSSSVLTSEASVKRGGGWVKCCLGSRARSLRISPSVRGGTTDSCSSSGVVSDSSRDSTWTAMKPANFRVEPWARKRHRPASMSADTVS